jgi:hypothetical protein
VAYELSLRHRNLFSGTVLMSPALGPALQHSSFFGVMNLFFRLIELILPSEMRVAMLRCE